MSKKRPRIQGTYTAPKRVDETRPCEECKTARATLMNPSLEPEGIELYKALAGMNDVWPFGKLAVVKTGAGTIRCCPWHTPGVKNTRPGHRPRWRMEIAA